VRRRSRHGSNRAHMLRSRSYGSSTTLHCVSISMVARRSVVQAGQAGCPFAAGRPVFAKVLHISLMLRAAFTLSGSDADIMPLPGLAPGRMVKIFSRATSD
jgi:hypothetical protein